MSIRKNEDNKPEHKVLKIILALVLSIFIVSPIMMVLEVVNPSYVVLPDGSHGHVMATGNILLSSVLSFAVSLSVVYLIFKRK